MTAIPDMRGFLPLAQMLHRPTTPNVILDMSFVDRIDCTGLNLFFSGAAKLMREADIATARVQFPENPKANGLVQRAKIAELIGGLSGGADQADLFIEITASQSTGDHQLFLRISNKGEKKRDQTLDLFRVAVKAFLRIIPDNKLNKPQLLLILSEIVKNTLDHSGSDAILGIDLDMHEEEQSCLRFSYCEQGPGLCAALRMLASNRRLLEKGGLSDLIHWALQPGNSTKVGNGVNFGLGMTMIVESANGFGMSLAMIDARSWVNLSNLPRDISHAALRRRLSSSIRHPCFSYLGELHL